MQFEHVLDHIEESSLDIDCSQIKAYRGPRHTLLVAHGPGNCALIVESLTHCAQFYINTKRSHFTNVYFIIVTYKV